MIVDLFFYAIIFGVPFASGYGWARLKDRRAARRNRPAPEVEVVPDHVAQVRAALEAEKARRDAAGRRLVEGFDGKIAPGSSIVEVRRTVGTTTEGIVEYGGAEFYVRAFPGGAVVLESWGDGLGELVDSLADCAPHIRRAQEQVLRDAGLDTPTLRPSSAA